MTKKIIFLLGLSIVLLYACQDNPVEEFYTGNQSLFSYNGNNNAGKSLLQKLEVQPSLKEETGKILGDREEVLYNYASLRLGSVYGAYYLLPVRDKASGVVNRALVYKVDAKVDQGKVRLANSLSEVLVLDEAELSRIPAYRRFLYSYPFKQWEDQGLKVLSSLSAYAKKLDGKLVPVETSELPSPVSKILTSWVTVTYELDINAGIEGGNLVIDGVPSSEIEAILIRNAGVFQVYVDEAIDISVDYGIITIRSVGGDIVSHPDLYTAIENLMWACDAELAAEYPYYNRSIWQVTATSVDPPEEDDDDNNNTGGSSGGGSTGGGSNDNEEENECSKCHKSPCECCPICENICTEPKCPVCQTIHCTNPVHLDCDSVSVVSKQLVLNRYDTIVNHVNTSYNRPSWEDFLNTINANPSIEHATSLAFYDGEHYQLTRINSGNTDSVKMDCDVYTLAIIHSHPAQEAIPPSLRDVYNTIRSNKEFPKMKIMYVYVNGDMYALIVQDTAKASAFLRDTAIRIGADGNFAEGTQIKEDFESSITNDFSGMTNVEKHAFALAKILEQYNAGVQLLRKKSSETGFSVLKTKVNNKGKYTATECK